MNEIDWTELKQIFTEVCELGPEERVALLERRCAGKPWLRAELEEYLRHHAELRARPSPPSTPTTGEAPGARIGRYRLLEELGEGGFGKVWLAEQEEPLKRLVALKLLKPGMDSRAVLARFDVERQSLALMDHPGIARIHDGGATQEGRPYFVMELVRGLPITRYCDEHGSSTAERLALFREVCLAVQHAHQKGVIHRDLKPSNVLVTEQDGKPQPKVIDFGVAKATGMQLTEKTLATGVDQLIGTPDYMAPEQAAPGNTDIDTRADVYALGVLLYELLTGTRPFDSRELLSRGLEQLLRTLREVEPERPSLRLATLGEMRAGVALRRGTTPERLHAALARDLDWLVMRALEKERSRRYATVQDFADDVERFLRHEPLSASPPSATYKLRKFVRRNRGLVVAVCAVGLALLAGTATTWRGYYLANERSLMAEQKSTEAGEQRAVAVRLAASEKAQRELAVASETQARRELARSRFFIELLFDMLGSPDPHQASHADMKVSEMLERFENELAPRLEQEAEVKVSAHLVLAHAWLEIGDLPRAGANLDAVRDELARKPDEADLARYQELQATRLHEEREWSGAIAFQRQALASYESLHRPEDLHEMPGRQAALADLLDHAGRHEEAEQLARAAFDSLAGREPIDAEALEVVRTTLAKVLIGAGNLAGAEELLQAAPEPGPGQDGSLARLQASLMQASLLIKQGQPAAAEVLLRALEPRLHERLGERNRNYWGALTNLGVALLAQGKTKEAEAVDRKVLELARASSPSGSSALVGPLNELGSALLHQARFEEALPFLLEALGIRRLKAPDEEPDRSLCAENVGGAYYSLSRYAEAEPFLAEVVEVRRRLATVPREELDMAMLIHAEVLCELGRFADAERGLRERMSLYASTAEDPAPLRAFALCGLGEALLGLERWTEAEIALRESLQLLEALPRPSSWMLETLHSLLGAALVGEGRAAEGEPLLRSAAKQMKTPALRKGKKRAALQRLLRYLEASGQSADADACRSELEQLK